MDQHKLYNSTYQSWPDPLSQDWDPRFDLAPRSAQQQVLFEGTASDIYKSMCSEYPVERRCPLKGAFVAEHGGQFYTLFQQSHDKVGRIPIAHTQVKRGAPCSWSPVDSLHDHPLLGVMASLLDDVASHFVFGAFGTPGRPKGCITLDVICRMDDDNHLNKSQRHRWLQFLQIWQNAGWGCSDVILLAEELRPLQYYHPHSQAQLATIDAKQMLACISSYGNSQGHRRFKLKESLIRFLNVVQQHFSGSRTVLLRATDVFARLSKVQVTSVSDC